MTDMPSRTLYHRWLGWHALALRRTAVVIGAGLVVALVLLPLVRRELAVLAGWDAAALALLLTIWPIIVRADGDPLRGLDRAVAIRRANPTLSAKEIDRLAVAAALIGEVIAAGSTA